MLLIISGVDTEDKSGISSDGKALSLGKIDSTWVKTGVYDPVNPSHMFTPNKIDQFKEEIDKALSSEKITSIKIGALFSLAQIDFLVERLSDYKSDTNVDIVFDPVLGPSKGGTFVLDEKSLDSIRSLASLSTIVTPNTLEFEKIFQTSVETVDFYQLKRLKLKNILIKGGHLSSKSDLLICKDFMGTFFSEKFGSEVRGTGCYLSTAIAKYLEIGNDLKEAVTLGVWDLKSSYRLAHNSKLDCLVELDELNYELFPKVYLPGLESEALKSPELKIKANNRIYPICENVDIYNRLKKLNPALIQLRIKEVPFSSLGRTLNEIDQGDSLACKILNDFDGHINPEIFGGIHLGQEDIYRADLSAIKEKKLVLGVSTHCYFELAIAAGLSPSYVALGPIFDTPCKSMSFGPRGYEKIREWKKILRTIPVVAIGGMTPKRAKEAFQYGADVVAVQSDITLAENPEERFLHYVEYLAK